MGIRWRASSLHSRAGVLAAGPLIAAGICSACGSSATPTASISPVSSAGGIVLALTSYDEFVIADLGSGRVLHQVPLTPLPGGTSLIASDPAGGWVVTYKAEGGVGLAAVDLDATVHPATGGPFPLSSTVSGLAISADGSQVAIAYRDPAGAPRLDWLSTPGQAPQTHFGWRLDASPADRVVSISWSPDDHHLSYIVATSDAKLAGDPAAVTLVDHTAPTTSTWRAGNEPCPPSAVTWLGNTLRFAAVRECGEHATYGEVDPTTGAPTSDTVTLPGPPGCPADRMHTSATGSPTLITRCNRVDLVANGYASQLDPRLTDAAWAGEPIRVALDHEPFTTAAATAQAWLDLWRTHDCAIADQTYLTRDPQAPAIDPAACPTISSGTTTPTRLTNWNSPNSFTLLMSMDLHFITPDPTWVDSYFITFTRPDTQTPFRMELNTGP